MSSDTLSTIGHNVRIGIENVSQAPANWPYIFFFPSIVGMFIFCHQKFPAEWKPLARHLICGVSILTLIGALYLDFSYLSTSFLTNSYATWFAMIAWMFHLGLPMYSGVTAAAPYSLPYGPYGFLMVSLFQDVFGPTIVVSKLAPFLAAQASLVFLYLSLRKRVSWLGALFLAALYDALLYPFDPFQFWPRPDLFLVLAATGGLWASTRRGIWSVLLLGAFIGFAVNLKAYALVFFFLPVALAARDLKSAKVWLCAGLAAAVVAILPFFCSQISIDDYLRIMKMDSKVAFQDYSAIQSIQWIAVLMILGFSPFIVHRWEADKAMATFWRNTDLWGSLLVSFLFITYPCFEIDAHHMMPLIPITLFLAAHFYSDISAKSLLERTPSYAGSAMVISIAGCVAVYILFLNVDDARLFQEKESLARERIDDIQSIYAQEGPCVILNASGTIPWHDDDYFYRAILVFNGMPIGIDSTAAMDYKFFGHREFDLEKCLADVDAQYHVPIVFICPNDALPFSEISHFPPQQPVFSDAFVNGFYRDFQFFRRSTCFDVYTRRLN